MSPDEPMVWRQVNTEGGTGFIGGTHYHLGSPDPKRAVQASIDATAAGSNLSPTIDQWSPQDLGVHASITVHAEATLTPYLDRPHDQRLRGILQALNTADASSQVLLVVGTSCTGKTRTLYEAVQTVLPAWQLVAPRTDTGLARLLFEGVPARTVVWLDELQNKLTKLSDGVTAARAIAELLSAQHAGPILFAGTIWPSELRYLTQRPGPEESAVGASAITSLLRRAITFAVPDAFTDDDLAKAPDDPRIKVAIATATSTNPNEKGRRLTQLLSGGSTLVRRLHCDPENPGAFSTAARALVYAAGDLRRVGMPNPLPRWALEESTPGYLGVRMPPGSHWFQTALDELTAGSLIDDIVTGTHGADIHADGIPALTPTWATHTQDVQDPAYHLHDYLLQDHLARYRHSPTKAALWDTLVSRPHSPETLWVLSSAAADRGLLTYAIAFTRPLAGTSARARFRGLTMARDDPDARAEQAAEDRLVALLASRGDPEDIAELRRLAASNKHAQYGIVSLLAQEGDPAAIYELNRRARVAQAPSRIGADSLLSHSLDTLRRSVAGNQAASDQLEALLVGRENPEGVDELRRLAVGDRRTEAAVATLLDGLGHAAAIDVLRSLADGNDVIGQFARIRLADRLAERGHPEDIDELRRLGDLEERARYRLGKLLASRGDPEAIAQLESEVHSGYGAMSLLGLLRLRAAPRRVRELDPDAHPVYAGAE